MGGALATIGKAQAGMVAANTVWVKNGVYDITTAVALVGGGASSGYSQAIGYNTTRGDLNTAATVVAYTGCPTIRSNNAAINLIFQNASYAGWHNFKLDAGSGGTKASKGCVLNTSYCVGTNLYATGAFTSTIFQLATTGTAFFRCFSERGAAGTSAPSFYLNGSGMTAVDCVAYNSDDDGFWISGSATLINCVAYNCDGDGFVANSTYGPKAVNCVAYGNGGDGFRANGANGFDDFQVWNCVAYGNGGYGFNSSSTDWTGRRFAHVNNAAGKNTSGDYNQIDPQEGAITLLEDPFVDGANGDFRLNELGNGGALLKQAGRPGQLPKGVVGYADVGVVQEINRPVPTIVVGGS